MALMPIEKAVTELDPASDEARLLFDESPEATMDWIEHFLTVPNELGQIVPMKLYPQQIMMLQDETGRDITVKGRQTRASSLKMARNLRRMVTGQVWGATCVTGAQDDATTAIFRTRILHHLENDLANKGFKFEFEAKNYDEIRIKGLENRFLFVSGEQRTMSRGFSAQIIHFSEFAHWRDSALELIGGAIPAVPAYPYGRIDLESTPKGQTGAFYEYANDAKPINPMGLWTVHLYPWWLEPRYRVSNDPYSGCDIIIPNNELLERQHEFTPTDHEHKLMTDYSLNINQVLWRRYKKIEQDRTQAPFLQEYPEDLDTCWLGVQGKFFDTPDGIDHLEYYRETRRNPVKFMERLTYRGDEVLFHGPNLAVWEFPDQNDTYVAGFDTAGGGIGRDSDYSVVYVASVRKEKIVARLRVQASPKMFAAMICAIVNWYKTALVNGERSHQGAMVFEEMRDLNYSNIYYHVDPMKPLGKNERPQAGMYPTAANRQTILERLKSAVTSHAIECFCSELVREMNVFTWQKFKDRMKAAAVDITGQHDDCIFAAAYTWFIIDKARNRLKSVQKDIEEEVITIGRNGMVMRKNNEQLAYNDRLWFR